MFITKTPLESDALLHKSELGLDNSLSERVGITLGLACLPLQRQKDLQPVLLPHGRQQGELEGMVGWGRGRGMETASPISGGETMIRCNVLQAECFCCLV
jgi:hypothetical protein